MERKLATVLFVDLVESTRLVAASDPEVVRRRIGTFFERVSHCIEVHGGKVEKFAGDAVLAAFGIPQAHEDDAERAARAALAMRDSIRELGLEVRIGVEAGELVVDETEQSFATGEAVNLAARLQQTASPGEILVGPTAYRLALGRLVAEDAGPLELKGIAAPLRAWRLLAVSDGPPGISGLRAPLIGRDTEFALLANTHERAVRAKRAHLVTIYGEPGVGKSRLAREFIASLEGATILCGRCLPYGEGVTYWPLAEMIKAAAGISDDDPLEEAFEKLRAYCEDEAVADLLGLASGLLEALEGERSPEEIQWAAREIMESLAKVQPLVLFFEDIHWAADPMLELIEYLADWVRSPLLILCLARTELLDVRPGWGGGRLRWTAIELEALGEEESAELVEALMRELDGLPGPMPHELLERTEGNPLFVEETIRMLAESSDPDCVDRIPDTLQALIAARIDRLAPAEKALLQRGSIVGRIFWRGAIEYLSPDLPHLDQIIDDLLLRDFLLPEARSSISGEKAYRFKHVLIREVAYAGLSKNARAQYHALFADWLHERAGEELLEIRAYHLDQASLLLAELDGAPPPELAHAAAAALASAGKRALAREALKSARRLLSRAVELEPTLHRRYQAARAARSLGDLPATAVEMERVREEAKAAGDKLLEARALTGLSEVALRRSNDIAGAEALVDRAIELLADETDPDAHFDALVAGANVDAFRGDLSSMIRHLERAFAVALAAGRKDLQTNAARGLASAYLYRLELDQAEPLMRRALELGEESGSIRSQAAAKVQLGKLLFLRGELDEAEAIFEDVRSSMAEIGSLAPLAAALAQQAGVRSVRGDLAGAEKLLREALRLFVSLGEAAQIGEVQCRLVHVLIAQGRLDEAERLANDARERFADEDPEGRIVGAVALAAVRAEQGRDNEAEELLRSAVGQAEEAEFGLLLEKPLELLAQFLRERDRAEEAVAYEERLAELFPARRIARIA